MRRYVCHIGTKGLTEVEEAIRFQAVKVEVQTQWNAASDNSILIFVKDPSSYRTEILGLPD